ncbi:Gfo/Idh/MocA family protein [Leeuwenhoekiella nanhaiensis]|uniref:Dehydrogenase n=1 Tax=Leeuwenhoekiella nanhaiensis TaxID=1655491 RepID=A0A2G1VP59_9FLAO|nr:Gfo/Idh/MocA family oxidoreductase [Leeuwenhoekiella nanhaiensis]PHQ28410.1 dehydrogenase [Leeuwenhoekiella nanhaiensis]
MKRRDFVVKSGLAAAAVTSVSPGFAYINKYINNQAPVRLGVIGTGARGSGLISVINDIEGLDVVACCDILSFRLKEGLKRAKGTPKAYTDYRKLLEDKEVDAVLVATPFSTHGPIELEALAAGKHIYGEKTLAKGYEDVLKLAEGTRDDLVFQTGHQYHSSRLYTQVVDLIKDGKVGKITSFECQWNRSGNWRRSVPEPELERLINWRMYREYSGGLTAELCSHQIDFVNWVLGETPAQVFGTGGIDYWKDGRETFDNVHHLFSYPSGVEATFTCLTTNAKDDYQIKVMGDKGTIILDYVNGWFYPEGNYTKQHTDVDGVAGATIPWEAGKGIPFEFNHTDPSKQALMDFSDAIRNGNRPLSDFKTGADTAICVQMAIDSMLKNEIVKWNPLHSL